MPASRRRRPTRTSPPVSCGPFGFRSTRTTPLHRADAAPSWPGTGWRWPTSFGPIGTASSRGAVDRCPQPNDACSTPSRRVALLRLLPAVRKRGDLAFGAAGAIEGGGEVPRIGSRGQPGSALRGSCVRDPATESDSGVPDSRERFVLVVPAEGLDLLEDIDSLEVSDQLLDEGAVEARLEGVAGDVVREVVEDRGDR